MKAKSYLAGAVLALAAVCSAAEVGTAGAVRPPCGAAAPMRIGQLPRCDVSYAAS